MWLSVVLRMKTELIWLQHLISTDLELFRIVLYQKISGNICRHNSRCALDYKESCKIRSFNGNLLPWWTRKSKERKMHSFSLQCTFLVTSFSVSSVTLRVDFYCRVFFYVRTCVKFTFANKIEAKNKRSFVSVSTASKSQHFISCVYSIYLINIYVR